MTGFVIWCAGVLAVLFFLVNGYYLKRDMDQSGKPPGDGTPDDHDEGTRG